MSERKFFPVRLESNYGGRQLEIGASAIASGHELMFKYVGKSDENPDGELGVHDLIVEGNGRGLRVLFDIDDDLAKAVILKVMTRFRLVGGQPMKRDRFWRSTEVIEDREVMVIRDGVRAVVFSVKSAMKEYRNDFSMPYEDVVALIDKLILDSSIKSLAKYELSSCFFVDEKGATRVGEDFVLRMIAFHDFSERLVNDPDVLDGINMLLEGVCERLWGIDIADVKRLRDEFCANKGKRFYSLSL